jgi:capsid protein
MFDIERANLASDFCQPIYEALIFESVMLGVLDCPGFEDPLKRMAWLSCNWIGDAPVMLDPLKETTALKMQVDEQFKTRSQATLEMNGGDYSRNVEELAEEARWREENGIPEPGAVNRSVSVSEAKQIIDETEDEK